MQEGRSQRRIAPFQCAQGRCDEHCYSRPALDQHSSTQSMGRRNRPEFLRKPRLTVLERSRRKPSAEGSIPAAFSGWEVSVRRGGVQLGFVGLIVLGVEAVALAGGHQGVEAGEALSGGGRAADRVGGATGGRGASIWAVRGNYAATSSFYETRLDADGRYVSA